MKTRFAVCAALCAAMTVCVQAQSEKDLVPNGRRAGTLNNPGGGNAPDAPPGQAGKAGGKGGNGINYHNGPVMTNPINVYLIWYGDWTGNSAVGILEDLIISIGGSPYWNINTTYYQTGNVKVSNQVHFVSSYPVPGKYPYGTSLSDANIKSVVTDAIAAGLPKDTNGVYFVLTSADVTASSGFCTQYCGWHTHGTIAGANIKYSFVGNPDRCPNSCAAQTVGPNGNAGADGMASIVAHELEEAATDPDLNAWYDTRGYENADKCAWTFGATTTLPTGAKYNVTLGNRKFLIQRNWVNAGGGYCSMAY